MTPPSAPVPTLDIQNLSRSCNQILILSTLASGIIPSGAEPSYWVQAMEAKLRGIVEACAGRTFSISGGVTPLDADVDRFVAQVRVCQRVVRKVMEPLRG